MSITVELGLIDGGEVELHLVSSTMIGVTIVMSRDLRDLLAGKPYTQALGQVVSYLLNFIAQPFTITVRQNGVMVSQFVHTLGLEFQIPEDEEPSPEPEVAPIVRISRYEREPVI